MPLRSILILLPLLLAPFLMIPGCTGKEEKGITFSVGGAPSELDYWEKLVGEFESESGIRVELLRQPTDTDQRRQGLVIALEAGRSDPDVFLMDVVWIAQFAASRWLEPFDVDGRMQDGNLNLEAFFPNVVELADRYGGELIALPVYVDGGASLLQEGPPGGCGHHRSARNVGAARGIFAPGPGSDA